VRDCIARAFNDKAWSGATKMTDVATQLDAFVQRYLDAYPQLIDPFDPQWRSPCEAGEPFRSADGAEWVAWSPLRRAFADDFAGLERALEVPIHADIKAYYGTFWSGGLEATATDGHVSLILLWNPADARRLVENLIGHALAKRRARAPLTVFFACTEPESDLFLSVDNATGQVVLEAPGAKPLRTVAPSLTAFLRGLAPAAPGMHPERGKLGSI
jgi:SecY interacting protein Syd